MARAPPATADPDDFTTRTARELDVNTQGSQAWKNAATLALDEDGSWLILTSFEFGVESSTTNVEVRLQQDDTTDLQYGRLEDSNAGPTYKNWFWMTRVERDGSDVKLDLGFEPMGNVTAYIRNVIITAILLDDLGTEDTDWRWGENSNTYQNLNNIWGVGNSNILTETWTPGTEEDWLILANLEITANGTSKNADARLNLNDNENIYDYTTEEGEDGNEWRWWSSLRLLTLPTSAQKFGIQARTDVGSGVDIRRARFFAVRTAVFDQVAVFSDNTFTNPTATSTWEEKLDASFTPNQTENVLILGHVGVDYGGVSRIGQTRVHEEETDNLMHPYALSYDSTDLAPTAFADILNWDTTTHDADLDIYANNTGVAFGDAAVIFISLHTAGEEPSEEWSIVETWTGDVTAKADWDLIQTWDGTVDAPASWSITETWSSMTVTAPANWSLIQTWTGTISGPQAWSIVETWTGAVEAKAEWVSVESWTSMTINAKAVWQLIETWDATVDAPAAWQLAETWDATVDAPANWQLIETWEGTVENPVVEQWALAETWDGTVEAPAVWIIAETWNNTGVDAPAVWGIVEVWSGDVDAPRQWNLAETWTGTVTAPSDEEWNLAETWTGMVDATIEIGIPIIYIITINENDGTVMIEWENAANAITHHIQVDNNPAFTSPYEYDNDNLPDNNFLAELLGYRTYWRVRGENATENGGWSDVFSFNLGLDPYDAAQAPAQPAGDAMGMVVVAVIIGAIIAFGAGLAAGIAKMRREEEVENG